MRTVPEWQGKSDDEAVPARVRRRIFDKHEGRCAVCTRDLRSTDWDLDHLIPLAVGGRHAESNLRPLCANPCHSNKTVLDVKLKAKAERIRKRHIGIKKPRSITTWRRFNGEIVRASRER
jgi:5-methylcytosine-specific restriction protein A